MKPITILFLLFSLQFAHAQNALIGIPKPKGILKQFINDIQVDNQQNIWVAFGGRKDIKNAAVSNIGLAMYNGTAWTTYDTTNSAIPTNTLTCIAFQGNTKWIGSRFGLIKFENNVFTQYKPLIDEAINAIAIHQNKVWVGTNTGVAIFDGTNWQYFDSLNSNLAGNSITALCTSRNNEMWIGTNSGVSVFKNNTFTSYTKTNSKLHSNNISSIAEDNSGAIWIGTDTVRYYNSAENIGLYRFQNGTITPFDEYINECSLIDRPVDCRGIVCSKNGKVFMLSKEFHPFNQGKKLSIFEISGKQCRNLFFNNSNIIYNPYFSTLTYASNDKLIFSVFSSDSIWILNPLTYQSANPNTTGNPEYLDVNKVLAPLSIHGNIGWDERAITYRVPKESCKSPLMNMAPWFGGLSNNQIHTAAQTYRQSGDDYFSGPITLGNATSDSITAAFYKKLWKVNRFAIEQFKDKYQAGDVTNGKYMVPAEILNWPAHGDTTKGYAKNLAPFIDYDNDGKYNPYAGDYPAIKGDQSIFYIINDNASFHSESQGIPLGIEIHVMAYAYVCDKIAENDTNTALNYTTFYNYKIFNRSNTAYSNFKMGMWAEMEIGPWQDDFIGCNPKHDYAYCYNRDAIDDNSSYQSSYGTAPPALALALLKGPIKEDGSAGKMDYFMNYDNIFALNGNPTRPEHYWGYMNSQWKDGTSLTYGGRGNSGTDPATHIFPGNNDLQNRPNWTDSIGYFYDGRFVFTTNAGTLNPGAVNEVEFALVWSRTKDTMNWPNPILNKLHTDVLKVKNWYANQSFPSCLDLTTGLKTTTPLQNKTLVVYPNPANQSISLQVAGLTTNATYQIIDITGRKLLSGNLQESISVSQLQSGVYFVQVNDGTQQFVTKFIKN